SFKSSPDAGFKHSGDDKKKVTEEPGKQGVDPSKEGEIDDQEKDDDDVNNTNNVNAANTNEVNAVARKISIELPDDPNMPELEDIVYSDDDEDIGAEVDMNNLDAFMPISPIPTTRVHKDHPVKQIIGDLNSAPQTRRMIKNLEEHEEPKKEQEGYKRHCDKEQSKIGCLRVHTRRRIDYDEMDVKSAFIYGKIEEEVYVCQPPGFEDPDFPDNNRFQRGKIDMNLFIKRDKSYIRSIQVYVDDIIFGSTRKKMCIEFEKMMHKKFHGLQVKNKEDGIFISQDKYVNEILNKFGFSDVKTARTPMETQKALLKDANGKDVDEHLYRLMIGSLMYLTSSRPDIMFEYPKDSPFDLVAYTDNDYAGVSLDRKSTTGGALDPKSIAGLQI
ncbi:putative ribonuclease H-like domain-containing protein, partial [Tanacetum coccineum]